MHYEKAERLWISITNDAIAHHSAAENQIRKGKDPF